MRLIIQVDVQEKINECSSNCKKDANDDSDQISKVDNNGRRRGGRYQFVIEERRSVRKE